MELAIDWGSAYASNARNSFVQIAGKNEPRIYPNSAVIRFPLSFHSSKNKMRTA